MKRFLAGLVLGAVLATGAGGWAQETVVRLFVDGQEILFPEAPPQIINGRVMVPARPLAEALGATVKWDAANRSVLVTSPEPVVAAPVAPAPAPEPVEMVCPTPETTAEEPAPAPKPAAEAPAGPVAASVGEWLQFTNMQLMVTGIRYEDVWAGTIAPPGERVAVLSVAVKTGQVSVNPSTWPNFVKEWKLRSGKSLTSSFMPATTERIGPNQDRVIEHGVRVPARDEVVSVTVRSLAPEDSLISYLVTLP